jgi:hypothetical protein
MQHVTAGWVVEATRSEPSKSEMANWPRSVPGTEPEPT